MHSCPQRGRLEGSENQRGHKGAVYGDDTVRNTGNSRVTLSPRRPRAPFGVHELLQVLPDGACMLDKVERSRSASNGTPTCAPARTYAYTPRTRAPTHAQSIITRMSSTRVVRTRTGCRNLMRDPCYRMHPRTHAHVHGRAPQLEAQRAQRWHRVRFGTRHYSRRFLCVALLCIALRQSPLRCYVLLRSPFASAV